MLQFNVYNEYKYVNKIFTLMFGISSRPLKSRVPGGKGNPSAPFPRDHLTLTRSGPSSLHWKTTSRP